MGALTVGSTPISAADWSALRDALVATGATVESSVSVAATTTYRVGGPARLLVGVPSVEVMRAVARAVAEPVAAGLPVLVIGRGSNLLVADEGFDGIVVRLGGDCEFVADEPDARLVAGGAAALPVVARRSVALGLTGFEWAVGVPGSVGGAVRMNAGGHGSDVAASLVDAEVVDLRDGSCGWVPASALALGYRTSAIESTQVVTQARFQLAVGDPATGETTLSEIVRWRREHQPGGANAGSVFRNPPGDSAGRLIEAAGCKGWRVGSAEVSTKHANFIQVDSDGRAADVVALMGRVIAAVDERFGVRLHPETHLAGFAEVPW